MAKIRCNCGELIEDQTDNLEYKAYIIPDIYIDDISHSLTESIDSLITAIKSDKRKEWIRKNFSKEYPTDLKDSSMIHDLITRKIVETTQDMFECKNCRRVAIQIKRTNEFKFFKHDSEKLGKILEER